MLTRLRVSGFKNLLDVDVHFAPFTCVAGANGVGKSNLFDAITFLRLLASEPLVEAALSVRDETGRNGDIRSLFFHHGQQYAETMRFEAEMLTPKEGVDDLRQTAKATSTFLRYALELRYRGDDVLGPLEIVKEELKYITKGEAATHLRFPHTAKDWRSSVVVAFRSTGRPYISTEEEGADRRINIHQDGTGGRPQPRSAPRLPRTVLSSVNASESPTAVVARNEIMNWRLLQLEPTALRRSDDLRAPRSIAADGSHMPATLRGLASNGKDTGSPAVRQAVANRVAELVESIVDVWVDEDPKRELLTLHARMKDGTDHPARSLSDGTLRFLALAIIEQTPESGGLYCLEEPENGIHPERIGAMLELLQAIATDARVAIDASNPLRQVIINTHSPLVVQQVPEDCLIVAEPGRGHWLGQDVSTVRFAALPDTWRTKQAQMPACPLGRLLGYLNPLPHPTNENHAKPRHQRVIDRSDIQPMLPYPSPSREHDA